MEDIQKKNLNLSDKLINVNELLLSQVELTLKWMNNRDKYYMIEMEDMARELQHTINQARRRVNELINETGK